MRYNDRIERRNFLKFLKVNFAVFGEKIKSHIVLVELTVSQAKPGVWITCRMRLNETPVKL